MTTRTLSPDTVNSPFVERLLAIREEGKARTERRRQHESAKDVLRSQKFIHSYAFLADVEKAGLALLEELSEELPAEAKITRTFFDGRYHLVMRLEERLRDRDGEVSNRFSRMSFLLSPQAEDGRFEVETRATVRSRDLEGDRYEIPMTDAGLTDLAAFLETRLLAFAQSYFETSGFSRVIEERPDVSWISDSLQA
jgi:hypothetical protein